MKKSKHRSLFVVQHAAPLLVLVASMGLSSCAFFRIAKDPKKDYVFSVTGVVTTQDSTPLAGADVTLDVSGRVYEAIDLVRSKHVLANENGGFVFAYISHDWGARYTITVRKEGFESETVSGAAPPNASHLIKLRKTGEPTKTDARAVSSHYSLPTPLVGVLQ